MLAFSGCDLPLSGDLPQEIQSPAVRALIKKKRNISASICLSSNRVGKQERNFNARGQIGKDAKQERFFYFLFYVNAFVFL